MKHYKETKGIQLPLRGGGKRESGRRSSYGLA
jgi:hypothetical protein